MRFDVGDGVGELDGKSESARRFQGFERNVDGGHLSRYSAIKTRVNANQGSGLPAVDDDSPLRSGTGGTGI